MPSTSQVVPASLKSFGAWVWSTVAIPTVSEWGLIVMGVTLAGGLAVMYRRRPPEDLALLAMGAVGVRRSRSTGDTA